MSQSPANAGTSRSYENAWAAIQELLHEDGSWSSHERNLLYLNNGDGTFADVSGVAELDFSYDSRAFVTTDLDQDGDQDLILKSRTEPGLVILRNDLANRSNSVTVQLRGRESNRDAAGARVTVFGSGRPMTKAVRLGSGFLSQHSKGLLFGLGDTKEIGKLRIEWPSGLVQELSAVPINHRITVREGSDELVSEPFQRPRAVQDATPATQVASAPASPETSPENSGTWLVDPLPAPDFDLQDLNGRLHRLADYRGKPLIVNFWATWCPPCRAELRHFQESRDQLRGAGARLLAIAADEPDQRLTVKKFAKEHGLTFPVLLADEELTGKYNILKRYLFNRRSNMQVPTTFLLSEEGLITKVYEGPVGVSQILADLSQRNDNRSERLARALPFAGRFYLTNPRRNYSQLGLAFHAKGFSELALSHLERAGQAAPADPDTHYNLGILYMNTGALARAQQSFEKALHLKQDYPDAHNNLGVVLARQGRPEEATTKFHAALKLRSNYAEALNNLATIHVQQGRSQDALQLLTKALSSNPNEVRLLNSLGLLYAGRGDLGKARDLLDKAFQVTPNDPETLSNRALVLAQQGETVTGIRHLLPVLKRRPDFDKAYLVLAVLYRKNGEKEKAVAVLGRLLDRDPDHVQARSALEKLGK